MYNKPEWEKIIGNNYTLLKTNIGDKKIITYLKESKDDTLSSISILNNRNRGYFANLENGNIISSFSNTNSKQPKNITKGDLLEYINILKTLPYDIKEKLGEIVK